VIRTADPGALATVIPTDRPFRAEIGDFPVSKIAVSAGKRMRMCDWVITQNTTT
jgi:hypothetical protein